MQEKSKVRIGRLTTPGQVAIEIGRIYRQARYKTIDIIDAYRLANILSVLAKCLEAEKPTSVHAVEITLKQPDWIKIDGSDAIVIEHKVNGQDNEQGT